jgi:hypothetical protein
MIRLVAGATLLLAAALLAAIVPAAAQSPVPLTACNKSQFYDANTNGATQVVPAGGPVLICGFVMIASGTVNVGLVYGTGTNCATGQTKITPAFQFTAQTGLSDPSPYFRGMNAPGGNALCVLTSGGVAVQAIVYYYQQ